MDNFVSVDLVDVVVPFASSYRPLWLGLGALALDIAGVLIVTSLLKPRMPVRAWKFVHWLAYACWPVAVIHGFAIGTDSRATWLRCSMFQLIVVLSIVALRKHRRPDPTRGQLAERVLTADIPS